MSSGSDMGPGRLAGGAGLPGVASAHLGGLQQPGAGSVALWQNHCPLCDVYKSSNAYIAKNATQCFDSWCARAMIMDADWEKDFEEPKILLELVEDM